MSLDDLKSFQTLGIAGLPLLAFVGYKIWQMFKDDKRSDNNNSRMDSFYTNLQSQVEKMGLRIDELQKIRENLVNENANFSAQLTVAKSQIEDFKVQIQKASDREKYLEELLDKNGINYV